MYWWPWRRLLCCWGCVETTDPERGSPALDNCNLSSLVSPTWGFGLERPGGKNCTSSPLCSSTDLMYSAVTSKAGMMVRWCTTGWRKQLESGLGVHGVCALEPAKRNSVWQVQYLGGLGSLRWKGTVSNRLVPGASLIEKQRKLDFKEIITIKQKVVTHVTTCKLKRQGFNSTKLDI